MNPKGRPRSGLAFAEVVRERIDPHKVLDLAVKVMDDETLSPMTRLSAILPLVDRGYLKPPTTIAAHVQTSSANRDWSQVSIDERRELLERIRGAHNPKVFDAETVLLPAAVALATTNTDEE